ncbi:MAG: Type II restriction endonuclease TdeIII [Candidatus Shapirobacteria bacterium GW2011_GWE1_38_10]|uniref:type II site-specific deoxyribonuclease n=1 Tax=Candidatus Shapirobacteria bacterium GW2011_GWE1_38_10 TaxID=1618488 RepID=A0A0G0I2S7_9BACT|nr:MAG: Type II restriction endonuclease TdeIII [Candidatus Shapirobacteria bacterium GW2011_GWE1_38_10]
MDSKVREEIKSNLKNSIRRYTTNFSYDSFQPLDLIIPKERKIRSLVGGLETSMGTTVWEPIAKTLAKLNGFEVIPEKILEPTPFPPELRVGLSNDISARENRGTWISSNVCVNNFRSICAGIDRSGLTYIDPPPGTGVDVWLKKNGKEYAFDIKTVQPNVGGIKSFNKQILEWYAYRICKEPSVQIECKIVYPYNPYKSDFWSHAKTTGGILEPKVDALVENEFWNFLSGDENTYQEITNMLKELSAEGFGKELSNIIEKL